MADKKKRAIYYISATRIDLIDKLKSEKKRTGISIARLTEKAVEEFFNKKGEIKG